MVGKRASFSNVMVGGPQSEQFQHGMSVNVLDAVYSPDGMSLAVADIVSFHPLCDAPPHTHTHPRALTI